LPGPDSARSRRFGRTPHSARGYTLSILAGFLLFCALLRCQPWHSRLHLPLFVLVAPVVAIVLAAARPVRLANAAIVLLLLLGIAPVLLNRTRPLVGGSNILDTPRIEQYFAGRPELAAPYAAGVEFLAQSGCRQVGLYLGGDDGEYLFWVLGARLSPESIRWEHVAVTNLSGSLQPLTPFRPCAIVSTRGESLSELDVNGIEYSRVWSFAPVAIFQPQPPQ
jgi:hypothetical protein